MKKYFYLLATDQINDIPAKCIKAFLFLLSLVYWFVIKVVLFGYKINLLKTHSVDKPVICVGNITLGGAGKTPLVILISEYLKEKGLRPAILTRGYMAKKAYGFKNNELFSDEAILLQETLNDVPVLVGANRFKMAQSAIKNEPVDVFILDDGYQHWRFKRNINIVAINAVKPFGNGHLIPRGVLREPVSHLSRAHIFVLTKSNLGEENIESIKKRLSLIKPNSLILEANHHPVALIDLKEKEFDKDVSFLKGKTICSFCSIGDPESFSRTLLNLGADLKRNFVFMDHHLYTKDDIKQIVDYLKENDIDTLVTTEKDITKIEPYLDEIISSCNFLCLKIKIKITKGYDEFFNRISSLLNC